jgi:signal peptidase II
VCQQLGTRLNPWRCTRITCLKLKVPFHLRGGSGYRAHRQTARQWKDDVLATGISALSSQSTAMQAVPFQSVLIFAGIAIPGCLIDLASKAWIFNRLGMPGENPTWWICPEFFGLQTSLNKGALFGLGQGQVWLFASLSVGAAVGILYWLFFAGGARDRLLTPALGCVMAGILGNLYDRLGLWSVPGQPNAQVHAVRDWILWQYKDWVWPNFNIADSLLVCGAALLFWHAFLSRPPRESATNSKSP